MVFESCVYVKMHVQVRFTIASTILLEEFFHAVAKKNEP